MRILTDLARPGLELARPVLSEDGLPLLGRGTRLTARHLRHLHEAEVRVVEVVHSASLEAWEGLPSVPAFVEALDARFEAVSADRRMAVLKRAVRKAYLDLLLDVGP